MKRIFSWASSSSNTDYDHDLDYGYRDRYPPPHSHPYPHPQPQQPDHSDNDSNSDANSIVSYRPKPPRRPGMAAVGIVLLKAQHSIGFMDLPTTCHDLAREVISQTWHEGIRWERGSPGNYTFKLNGYPWDGKHSDSVQGRRLIRGILAGFQSIGWDLMVTTNIINAANAKDMLAFRQPPQLTSAPLAQGQGQEPEIPRQPLPPRHWFSVAFSMHSRLRLIDAPDDVLRDLIVTLPWMKEHEAHPRYGGVHDFEMKGQPFKEGYWWEGKVPAAPTLTIFLLQFLEEHGCVIYASLRQKKVNGEQSGSPDTWHLYRLIS